MNQARKLLSIFGFILITCSCAPAQTATSQVWVASWGASQQIPEPQNALPADDLRDATVRQIFHLSIGGASVRVHMSNAFGTEALHITAVDIARPVAWDSALPVAGVIDPTTDRAVTFAGSHDVTIPPGAEFVSDPVEFPVAALSDLAVTFHLDAPPATETGHPGSRATTFYVHGDAVAAPQLTDAKHVEHWYQLSGIDVLAPGRSGIGGCAWRAQSPMDTARRQTATIAGQTCWPRNCRAHKKDTRHWRNRTRELAAIIC